MPGRIRPEHHLLVWLQLGLFLALIWTHTWLARGIPWRLLELAGVLFGLWALAVMGLGQLRIHPEVADHAALRTHGPYRWVRHPMYTSVLTVAGALTLDAPSFLRAGLFAALAAVLVIKLGREEIMLAEKFPDYAAYARRTKRMLPGLW